MSESIVVGYPRSGFTLLINVIAELLECAGVVQPGRKALKAFLDTAGMQISVQIEDVFQRRGLSESMLYNYNFRQMVGGPKWLYGGGDDRACFRKYIGIRGRGDFTLLTSHPHQVLQYYEIIHSHIGPALWAHHPFYAPYQKFASIRHPAGVVASACFSLNALASEYLQRFLPAECDNDAIRQSLALYKLSDLNFFEALLTPLKAYLDEFNACADHYFLMRWEDLIQNPIQTIDAIAEAMHIHLESGQAAAIWARLDHVNLTGAHQHNLRRGHGIVGGWRRWMTNDHLDIMRDYGFESLVQRYGYESFDKIDESTYTPFQRRLALAIGHGEIIREYEDEDLFGYAFNKSNLDLTRFDFKTYEWRDHTRIERSTCPDDDLVMEVWDVAEHTCKTINNALDYWFGHVKSGGAAEQKAVLDEISPELKGLFSSAQNFKQWQARMMTAIAEDEADRVPSAASTSRNINEAVLLRSIGTTNIVQFHDQYYALPQSLGPIDLYRQNVSELSGVLVADTLPELITLMSEKVLP